nr:major facilitator superfamily domain-containing protein 9-like [Helicoverpa armigera]
MKPSWTFLLVGFLDLMSIFLILPYVDIHAKELGFNHIQIGLLGAVYPGCQMISSPIVGSIGDVRGRRTILLYCLIVCAITYFWLGITSSLLAFFGLRILLGTFKHTQLLTKALAPDYLDNPDDLSTLYGRLMSLGSLGLALGSVLSGYAMEAFPNSGFTIMCIILSAFFVINAGLINSLPETAREKKDKSAATLEASKILDLTVDTFKKTINKFYSIDWVTYWDIFVFKLVLSASVGLYYSNFRLFLMTEHGLSHVYLGYIVAAEGVVSSIINNSVAYINKFYVHDKDYSQRILHIFFLIVFSLVGLALVPNVYLFVVLLIPKAVSFSLARIVSLEVVATRGGPDSRGTLIGAFSSVRSIAGIVTPLISGVINHYLGVTYAFLTAALFATIGLVLSYRVRLKSIHEKTK